MNDNGHKRIRQAIENGYGGLTGDERLAARIINTSSRGWRLPSFRPLVITAMMLVLMVGVALALVPQYFSVTDSGSWTYVDNQLLYQGAEAKRPTVVLELEGIRHMAAEEGTGMLYYITRAQGGGFTLHNTTNYGKELYPSRHINAKYRIQDIVMDSSELYMLADTTTASGQIYRVYTYDESIPDELLNIPNWENKGTTSFAVKDGVLYAYNSTTQMLSSIDLRNHTMLNAPVRAGNLTAISDGYELDGEQYVLGISDGKLVAIGTLSGKILDTGVKLPTDAITLDTNSYTVHVGDSAGLIVGSYDITDLSGVELRQLYIVDASDKAPYIVEAEKLFREKYPDVEIVHRWTDGQIDYATEMMSGEPGIDIICFQDYHASISPLPMLLKNGAILDITDEPEISALREDYRDIWNLTSANGRLYGVLDSLVPTLWEVDERLAAQIGWDIPTGVWTWDDFDALIDLVIAYNETADQPIDLLLDAGGIGYAMEQFDAIHLDYFAGTSDYQSPAYINLLARQQRLAMNGLLSEKHFDSMNDRMDGSVLLRVDDWCVLRGMGNKRYILPPAFDANDPRYVINVRPMVINANTKLKEEAVYFLACLASVEAQGKKFYYNDGQWLKDKSLYVPEDPHALEYTGKPSDENEALFNYILEYGEPVVNIIEVWRTHFLELLPRLNEGEITPEEYAAIVQRQADMILGE